MQKKRYQMAKCKWTRHVILAINPIFVRNSGFELHKTTKLFLAECNQLNLSKLLYESMKAEKLHNSYKLQPDTEEQLCNKVG